MIEYLGLWFLGMMTLNMWALTGVLLSGAGIAQKAIWTGILLIPLFGFIAWFLLGPRARTAS